MNLHFEYPLIKGIHFKYTIIIKARLGDLFKKHLLFSNAIQKQISVSVAGL